MSHKGLMIIGAGGHGRVVADMAKRAGTYTKIAFLDDGAPAAEFPYPCLGKSSDAEKFLNTYDFVVAIGNCSVRKRIMEQLEQLGASFATVIAPDAVISEDVTIGSGTVICPGVVVNTGATLGKGVVLNTCCSVDHDCRIGDYCHVAVGAHICGTVSVDPLCWVGAGATVINNVSLCPQCFIGAGAVVVKDLQTAGTYLGVPAKWVKGK